MSVNPTDVSEHVQIHLSLSVAAVEHIGLAKHRLGMRSINAALSNLVIFNAGDLLHRLHSETCGELKKEIERVSQRCASSDHDIYQLTFRPSRTALSKLQQATEDFKASREKIVMYAISILMEEQSILMEEQK